MVMRIEQGISINLDVDIILVLKIRAFLGTFEGRVAEPPLKFALYQCNQIADVLRVIFGLCCIMFKSLLMVRLKKGKGKVWRVCDIHARCSFFLPILKPNPSCVFILKVNGICITLKFKAKFRLKIICQTSVQYYTC